jgi:predicted regulator of Ras-like GTPase activity (Roadblock/LC7/MglB family)
MAAQLPIGMDEERVAAMCAALLSLGERAADGLGRGGLEQVSIDGATGSVHLVSAADEAVLVGVASPAARTGLVLFEMRRVARVVADILASPSMSSAVQMPVFAGARPAEAAPEVARVEAAPLSPGWG